MFIDESPEGALLSPRQRAFCHEYVKDWNGARAARAAGYAQKRAEASACNNLKRDYIKDYIKHIQKDVGLLAGVSVYRVVEELSKIAFSSIAHLHNTWIDLQAFEQLTEDQKAAIESIDTKTETKDLAGGGQKRVEYVKIKLYNKIAAIERMCNILGYNAPTKADLTTKGQAITNGPTLTQDQINKLIDKL